MVEYKLCTHELTLMYKIPPNLSSDPAYPCLPPALPIPSYTPPPGGSGVLILSIPALFWWEPAPGAQERDSFSPLVQTEKHRRKKSLLLKILLFLPSYSDCLSSFSLSLLFLKEAQTYSAIIWTPSPSKFTPGGFYIWYMYLPLEEAGESPSLFYQLWFRLPAKASRACWGTELGPFRDEDKQVISAPALSGLSI